MALCEAHGRKLDDKGLCSICREQIEEAEAEAYEEHEHFHAYQGDSYLVESWMDDGLTREEAEAQEGAQRLQVLMKQVPDLTVEVRDVIADGDKVVVRAVWLGTDAVSHRKVEFHGFVQWRVVGR
jgi:predicted ester cyclase